MFPRVWKREDPITTLTAFFRFVPLRFAYALVSFWWITLSTFASYVNTINIRYLVKCLGFMCCCAVVRSEISPSPHLNTRFVGVAGETSLGFTGPCRLRFETITFSCWVDQFSLFSLSDFFFCFSFSRGKGPPKKIDH